MSLPTHLKASVVCLPYSGLHYVRCASILNPKQNRRLVNTISHPSRWIALKIEIPTHLKISEVLPYSFSHEILSKKIVSDRVALNSQTQFRDNGGLLAFDM